MYLSVESDAVVMMMTGISVVLEVAALLRGDETKPRVSLRMRVFF